MRVHALFGRMTRTTDRIGVVRDAADTRAAAVDVAATAGRAGADAALAARLRALRDGVDAIRKQIVATKEGGAITGEERLREHADLLYGALLQWEGRPGRTQLERIDALDRELGDVERQLEALVAKEVPPLDAALEGLGLPRIPTAAPPAPVADLSSTDVRAGVAAFLGAR
jgi:hypothetical protein